MKPYLQQSQSLRQELRMNPRLYQAMDLLYMPLLDLQQHLKQELLVNPFLELVEPDEEELDAETLEEPEEVEASDETDWEDIILDGFQVGTSARDLTGAPDEERYERVSVQKTGLAEHLLDQLQMLTLTDRQAFLVDEVVGNIGDDGYLQASVQQIRDSVNGLLEAARNGRPMPIAPREADEPPEPEPEKEPAEEEADQPFAMFGEGDGGGMFGVEARPLEDEEPVLEPEADPAGPAHTLPQAPPMPPMDGSMDARPFSTEEVEEMLRIVQTLDPPGVAARDLRECLLLQMRDAGTDDTLTYRLVRDHFDDLIAHRWGDIAKNLGIEPKAVQDAADELARLDPKPGLRFLPSDDEYVTPDLIVEKIEGAYRVFLNDGGTPRLRISQTYKDLAGDRKKFAGETKEFITEKLNSAQWLVQAIEQRRQTMLKVMNFIVDRQRDFFEKGIEHLRPLTLREVAEVIDMHESTVSRVTNQKHVQTPRGVYPLKFFFSSSLGTTSGEDASARAVRAQIEKLVGDEDLSKPMTDSAIVDELKRRGIQIARRTVAKYRDQLGILPARMRKRL